jgi:hypothetical protein
MTRVAIALRVHVLPQRQLYGLNQQHIRSNFRHIIHVIWTNLAELIYGLAQKRMTRVAIALRVQVLPQCQLYGVDQQHIRSNFRHIIDVIRTNLVELMRVNHRIK